MEGLRKGGGGNEISLLIMSIHFYDLYHVGSCGKTQLSVTP